MDVRELLNRSRRELLDISTRNRLLSIPVDSKSARIVQVRDELSEQVFRLLVTDKKSLSFRPGGKKEVNLPGLEMDAQKYVGEVEEEIGLPQPEDEMDESTGLAKRHVDLRLQTALSPEGLQRRLLDLYRDARTIIEEQGVNILYLALGHLKWFEAEQADTPRYAPLVLVPVQLIRKTASEKFYLQWLEEDVQENLSLSAKLKSDFGIELPKLHSDEDFDPSQYFDEVSKVIRGAKGWEVQANAITLGFFSFAKFLMYRDLDADNWPGADTLLKHPFITGLLQDGFPKSEGLLSEDVQLDDLIPASRLDHVVDADSSQTLAIEMVRQGRSLVIQGPPGTGKSQSITNIISTAVLDGKRVIFVAEKLAALEVVKRRLEREGLGPLCLELHSNKANKRAVIEEIGRTWKLGRPKSEEIALLVQKLEKARGILNRHAMVLHERLDPSGLSPFQIIGRLTAIGDLGNEAADLVFAEAETWTAEDRGERRNLLLELVQRVEQLGLPSQHVWRGVCRETVIKIDLDPLANRIRTLAKLLAELRETSAGLAQLLFQPVPRNFSETEEQRIIAGYVTQSPPVDKQALCSVAWSADLGDLRDAVNSGREFCAAVQRVGTLVLEATWAKDLSEARSHIVARGHSWFRLLNRNYRRAFAELRGAVASELPKTFSQRVSLLDQVVSGQRALRALRDVDELGRTAFGTMWQQERTDWSKLEAILDWVMRQREVGLDATFRRMFARVSDQDQVAKSVEELASRFSAARAEAWQLVDDLKLDCSVAFAVEGLDQIPLDRFADRCTKWLGDLESLSRWNSYFIRARRARELGLGTLVERLETGVVPVSALLNCFDRSYLSQMLRHISRCKPEIVQFDGMLHSSRVAEFKELDRERITLARLRTLTNHFLHMPPSNSAVGATGIVKGEMERKRGHRTVRRLLKDAGSVVQAIKPVFMMSPLSVAQFLEPGAVEFDLLVVDEASQVQPVDALGAIARCKQIVVVGDSKQLPPTRFFTRMTTESSDSEEDEEIQVAEAKDIESILGLCCARGLPQSMLRWHYRSRHHSLIAVSNHEFYEDRLFIVPSPYSAAAALGLKFNHIAEGVYDSGASRTNRVEAKAVCRAIIAHARNNPQLSLGVAAFSIHQQQAILDELEFLRREHPDLEEFFHGHPTEPFFVKNLENVQGDERDVIFISVGYGRDAHGFLAMRFGPLSNEGGERRLNVLISRAKTRCEVFSSIKAEDVDLERAPGRGVHAFKTFLAFAETGRLATAKLTGREEDSPFEEAVRHAVESLGYEVHAQVGIAGFFIDLAVLDKEHGSRYLLGIECDGAAYHSSRSARDRDRLRQAVLEDHGWIIHRIWSTDWFQRPAEQLHKVAEAIERAKTALHEIVRDEAMSVSLKVTAESEDGVERETVLEMENKGFTGLAVPYKQARIEVPKMQDPGEMSTKDIANILIRIVEQEGPIHEDEIVVRVRDLWGFQRAGNRIQDAVARGVRSLIVSKRCTRESACLVIPSAKVPVRSRENVDSPSLRRPDMLPPVEIRAAILALIDAHYGAGRREIPAAVARILGFKSTSGPLRAVIEAQRTRLLREGSIHEVNGMLTRSEATTLA